MEVFPLELQLFIAKKIAASSSKGLLSFRASTLFHRQLSEDIEVLRAVSVDCLHLLTIYAPKFGQHKFMRQLTLSSHVHFCVARAAQVLHQPHLDLPMSRFVLGNAYFAESDEATYFLITLRVLASEGFNREGILSIFNDLFFRQRLARYRDIISADGFLFDWNNLELRSKPPGLVYRFTCDSEGISALSNKIHNAHLSSPGADEDYDMELFASLVVLTSSLPGS